MQSHSAALARPCLVASTLLLAVAMAAGCVRTGFTPNDGGALLADGAEVPDSMRDASFADRARGEVGAEDALFADRARGEVGTADALLRDSARAEASTADASLRDSARAEVSTADASLRDSARAEASTADALPRDSARAEASTADASLRDSARAEVSTADASLRDSARAEVSTADGAIIDTRPDSAGGGPPAQLWQKALGGTDVDRGEDIAVDQAGNVYVTGYFAGTADLGGGNVISTKKSHDIFVTSFSAAGAHRWQKNLGGASSDHGAAIAATSAGEVYVTGYFFDTADLGGGTVTSKGVTDIFLTSFSATGAHRWQKALGGISVDSDGGIAVDNVGNVYLSGAFNDTADLGGGNATSKGSWDVLMTSFSAAGAHRWQKALGGIGDDTAHGVAVDSGGNVYLCGVFSGTSDLGGGNVSSKGDYDIFVTSFSAAGAHRWQKALGGAWGDYGGAIAIDTGGNVYLSGYFSATADLGGGNVVAKGATDIFVTSFSATGAHRWQRTLGGTGQDSGSSIAVDSSSNVYVTGDFTDTAELGGGAVTSKGFNDIFVTSFSASGAHRWQKNLGGSGRDSGNGIAVDSAGNVYVTGDFSDTADLGGGNVVAKGGYDVFVIKLGR